MDGPIPTAYTRAIVRPITLTFDDDLYSSIEELADRTGRPVEDLARDLIGEGIRSRARSAAREALRLAADENPAPLDDADAMAIATDEMRAMRAERRVQGRP